MPSPDPEALEVLERRLLRLEAELKDLRRKLWELAVADPRIGPWRKEPIPPRADSQAVPRYALEDWLERRKPREPHED